jgi:hypothetical protein
MATITEVGGPASWQSSPDSMWRHRLDARQRAELLAAVAQPGSPLPAFGPLPTLGPLLGEVAREVLTGGGVALIEGVPVGELSESDREVLAAGICAYFGSVVPQGERVAVHVRDEGADPAAPTSRSYEHRGRLGYHSDPAAVVALLCVRSAKSGGLSRVVSSVALHDELVRRRPELAEVLYQPWWRDNRAGTGYQEPVCRRTPDGRWRANYGPDYIRSAQRIPGVPPLRPDQVAAMAELDRLADDPRFVLTMDLRPGDMQFLNNHVVMHSRTPYEDHAEPDRRRDLIRVWVDELPDAVGD